MNNDIIMNVGNQPLDKLMIDRNWSNHDIVIALPSGHITHKQIQKARKGRRLSIKVQQKILLAVNNHDKSNSFKINDLFTYLGKKDL